MNIFALVGESGTGKSTYAVKLAYRYHIPAMIDDGLFIVNGKKVAGTSAKYEKTKIGAIRCAIFQNEKHRQSVAEAIANCPITSLLILGTSTKMVHHIAKQLQLPPIKKIYYIQELLTEEEIDAAKYARRIDGRHTIPISSNQIEKQFFEKIVARVEKIFSHRKKIGEQTIVHPPFQHGIIIIDPIVFKQLITHGLKQFPAISTIKGIEIKRNRFYEISVTIVLYDQKNSSLLKLCENIQETIYSECKQWLGIPIASICIKLSSIVSYDK